MIFKTEIGFVLCKLITYQLVEVLLKVGLLEYACDIQYTSTKNHLKMNKEIGMILPKKELIQVE